MKQSTPRQYWAYQLLLLGGTATWAFFDPYFEVTERCLFTPLATARPLCGGPRWAAAHALLLMAGVATLRLLLGFVQRSSSFRSLFALLAITSILSAWCGLATQFSTIAWQGMRFRWALRLDELENCCQSLRVSWPHEDGALAVLGPFMAYPFGVPTTLVLLTPLTFSNSESVVSSVERRPSGAILFRLSGVDDGVWIEWHPATEQPQSFIGGLDDPHKLLATASLGNGWHLVRYESSNKSPQMASQLAG